MINVDDVENLKNYIFSASPEKLARDMGWRTDGPGPLQYAEEKFIHMRKDFFDFFCGMDTISQAVFLSRVQAGKIKFGEQEFRKHYQHELTMRSLGTELDIQVEYSHDYDSDYGADRDGNRGRPCHTIHIENWRAFKNGVRIDHTLSKNDYQELEMDCDNLSEAVPIPKN